MTLNRQGNGGGIIYLTEQQIQPFPTSNHSVTSLPPSLTVNGFSISLAGGPSSPVSASAIKGPRAEKPNVYHGLQYAMRERHTVSKF